ncbi:MAG TPA: polyhydroxyalkanoate synthesis regulator DNA-binding domain-containing protein [Phycisphaerae bacterium]|nr:polyhydroxyalkanoate synthesis regulator DNA-binding domain-containing protein [Phycisphaerae bacterium]HRW52368.1 polyhydroxyalkanoate synthesis regulator DNA-binding domain-containing protein [Phycisphaerae bacterium]
MADPSRQRYEITKYPNRRFYDATGRRHVTLSDLYELVRSGHEIVVTDKTSGRDITNIVLTQIILEHDPPKMDLFPASLLHQAIQMNETMARSFIDQYLGRAMEAFSQSKRQFDSFLRQSGIPTMPGVTPSMEWFQSMFPGFAAGRASPAPPPVDDAADEMSEAAAPDDAPTDSQDEIAEMRRQLAALSRQVEDMKPGRKKATRKPGSPPKTPRRKKK